MSEEAPKLTSPAVLEDEEERSVRLGVGWFITFNPNASTHVWTVSNLDPFEGYNVAPGWERFPHARDLKKDFTSTYLAGALWQANNYASEVVRRFS